MRKIKVCILAVCLLLAGCESNLQEHQDEHFEKVSEQIEQIKTQADSVVPADTEAVGNIKVTVKMLTVDEQDFSAIDGLWQYASDDFVVYRRPDIFHESGIKVGISRGNLTAKLAAVKNKSKYSEQSEMFLVLADGSTGYVDIGKEILVPRFYYLNRWYEAGEYEFRRAGRGFKVTAVRIPERELVNLRITPVFSSFLSDRGDKKFNELMTNVTIKPGQSVLIGGTRTSHESLASALLGRSATKRKTDTVIVVDVSFQNGLIRGSK